MRWGVPGLLTLLLASLGLYARFRPEPLVESPVKSLVVLPFSADPQTEYLADGLTESLINTLSRFSGLRVTARAWAFNYKGRELDPRQIGQELRADRALMGKVVLRDDLLTVQVDLVDTTTGAQLWGERYQRKLAEMLDLEEEIGRRLAGHLRLNQNAAPQRQAGGHHTENPAAYQLYLQGRYHWEKDTSAGRQKAVKAFQQALAADNRYAAAYAWLAVAYLHLGINGELSPQEAGPQAQTYARQALALDEAQDEAHYVLGAVSLFFEWDAASAGRELKRALELNPNHAEGRTINAYYLLSAGRAAEAVAEVKKGEQLAPVSLFLKISGASIHYYARRNDEAIAYCRKALELEPNFSGAHYWLARAYLETARPAEALAEMKQWLALSDLKQETSPDLGWLYAVIGERQAAEQIMANLLRMQARENFDPYDQARLTLALGRKEQALAWLEKAYQKHSTELMWLRVNPQFDSLRADPQFQDLLRRMRFPE